MKKVAVIELLHHHECLELSLRALASSPDIDLTAFVGDFVLDRLGSLDVNGSRLFAYRQPFRKRWVKAKGPSRLMGIPLELAETSLVCARVIADLERLGPRVVFINTIDSPYLGALMAWLAARPAIDTVFVVHSTQALFEDHREAMLMKRFTNPALRLLFRRAAGLVLLGDYVKVPPPYDAIPRAVMNNRAAVEAGPVERDEAITFVVSGSMSGELRDYDGVLRAFADLFAAHPEKKGALRLVLLSRLDRRGVLPVIERLGLGDLVVTFDSFVSEADFDRWMRRAAWAIVPTRSGSPYGDYKISGPFGDALAYGVPILLPNHYSPGHAFRENVVRYRDGDLAKVLAEITAGGHSDAEAAAKLEAKRHTIEATSDRMADLLRRMEAS